MSTQLPQFTEDMNIISALADQPTLTSSELKAEFDLAGVKIKDYINNVLLPSVESALDVLDDLESNINSKIQAKLESRYYVGSMIVSSIDKNPATYLGFGTWELTGQGRVEIGVDTSITRFNTGGKTGGSFFKLLSSNHIPQLSLNKPVVTDVSSSINNNADLTYIQGTVVTGVTTSKETLKVGNANPQQIDIAPAYVTVYRYKRTA